MGRHTKARRARIQTVTRARKIQQERLEQRSNPPEPDATSLPTPSSLPHDLQPTFDHDIQPTELADCEPTVGEDSGLFVEDEFNDVEVVGGCEDNDEEDRNRQQARDELEADGGESDDSGSDTGDNRICVVNNQQISIEDSERMITALDKIVADAITGQGRHRGSKLDNVTLSRIRLMTASLRLRCALKCGLQKASQLAAVSVGRGTWAARRTRRYIRHFLTTDMLPENLYGGRWNESIIMDEDFLSAVKTHLLGVGKYAQARDILTFCGSPAAGEFSYLLDSPPSLRTAQRWMRILGYRWKEEKRGQYTDGHERPDVVEYRMKYYVPEWFKLETRMRSWHEDKETLPTLGEGEKIVVVWFHDESTFYAHDRRRTRWCLEGESLAIYKKGEGISMMVADFVSADYGWLRRSPENRQENEEENHARVVWRAGSRRDGWFCMRDVGEQLERAIAIAKDQYPNEEHVFVFDNAPIHKKLPDTVPNVARMTLNRSDCVLAETTGPDGEKIKVKMRPARFSDGSPQELYYPIDHRNRSWRGKFKGLATLLEERGVPNARKLRLKCPTTEARKGCPPDRTDCCAKRAMLNQPDFLHQKTELQIIAESHGCRVLFLPKFHCELNPIEQCWGMAKRVYQDYPDSSAEADLRRNMLSALDAVPLDSIRRFATRSRRFVRAYGDGLSGAQAASKWAKTVYQGHRVPSEAVMSSMDNLPA